MPALDDIELRQLAARAAGGESAALEAILASVSDSIYRLALRMLWHPEDAEDAAQEALISVMTRIGSYRGEAAYLGLPSGRQPHHQLPQEPRRAGEPHFSPLRRRACGGPRRAGHNPAR